MCLFFPVLYNFLNGFETLSCYKLLRFLVIDQQIDDLKLHYEMTNSVSKVVISANFILLVILFTLLPNPCLSKWLEVGLIYLCYLHVSTYA